MDLEEIDPLFFDRPYYVAPKPEGAKPYKLLLEAMEKSGKVGIAKVVMFRKEYLCALRPLDGALLPGDDALRRRGGPGGERRGAGGRTPRWTTAS